jgi:hypothetical protein
MQSRVNRTLAQLPYLKQTDGENCWRPTSLQSDDSVDGVSGVLLVDESRLDALRLTTIFVDDVARRRRPRQRRRVCSVKAT